MQGTGGADYVAADFSFTALRQYIRPQYQRVCATAEHLPFPDNSFRFLFTIAALEHVPCADLAFDEIHRVLKPGGVAYLHPAWHCTQYNCDGIPVRPYKDLTLAQRWVKLTLPVRQKGAVKAATALPGRMLRRLSWSLGRGETTMRFGRLQPDYQTFWTSDSDAASRLDSHEGCLDFQLRRYEVLSPGQGVRGSSCAATSRWSYANRKNPRADETSGAVAVDVGLSGSCASGPSRRFARSTCALQRLIANRLPPAGVID